MGIEPAMWCALSVQKVAFQPLQPNACEYFKRKCVFANAGEAIGKTKDVEHNELTV